MKRLFLIPALAVAAIISAPDSSAVAPNRAPLVQKTYTQLPIGAVKPSGWLTEQMGRMRDHMSGHLDEIYPEVVGSRNAWLGGDGDAWERGPYWIDGLLPLAYQLDDPELKKKVQPWIEWTLASQQPDGSFGPREDRPAEPGLQRDNAQDWWPRMVMLKVLMQHYDATGDPRVIPFMTNYFRYQLATLPSTPLDHWTFWGRQRGGDNLMAVYWLYNLTGDKFLLDLGELLHKQTMPWTETFLDGLDITRAHSHHCVNLAQGFKEPTVYWQQSQNPDNLAAPRSAIRTMRSTIGLPTGLWGGDELLREGAPTAGSELCTAVEMMFSLETMLEATANPEWADLLERIAFNVLPAQVCPDAETRQYYSQVNQVSVTRQPRTFSTPHADTDLLFGTLTGYPCCTTNWHQGWPKLLQNSWYGTADGGLGALVYLPSKVATKLPDGTNVEITEGGSYPFGEEVTFDITLPDGAAASFPLHLRVPAWCSDASLTLNGAPLRGVTAEDLRAGHIFILDRKWHSGDKLTLHLPMKVAAERWYDGGATITRGPLLYALALTENWTTKDMEPDKQVRYGKQYREVTTPDTWNYFLPLSELTPEKLAENVRIETNSKAAAYPWTSDAAPVSLHTTAGILPGWTEVNGNVGPVAYYAQMGQPTKPDQPIRLIPYGCTSLRIALFPVR